MGPLRDVAFYEFDTPGESLMIPRDEYWDGATEPVPEHPRQSYIIVNPTHRYLGNPVLEHLSCGHPHEFPLAKRGPFKGGITFCRRRRCKLCAMGAVPAENVGAFSA